LGSDEIEGCLRMLYPFQASRKACHQNKSNRNALFNLVIKYILQSLAAVAYILATKACPVTTFDACCRVPTKDRLYCFVAFLLGSQVFNNCIYASLSAGSLISMWRASRIIPRKGNDVEGPSSF